MGSIVCFVIGVLIVVLVMVVFFVIMYNFIVFDVVEIEEVSDNLCILINDEVVEVEVCCCDIMIDDVDQIDLLFLLLQIECQVVEQLIEGFDIIVGQIFEFDIFQFVFDSVSFLVFDCDVQLLVWIEL